MYHYGTLDQVPSFHPPPPPLSSICPAEYHEMLFFDNESWNIKDCTPLGITCIYTPRGLTRAAWEQGLKQFEMDSAARGAKVTT